MEVMLVRHGMTRGNQERRYIGRTDDPVCPEGLEALRRLPVDDSVDTVYVSPLRRTQQTASVLFPNARQIVVDDLREMDFGAFERRQFSELKTDPAYCTWLDGGCLGPCPGGESRAEFSDRVCAAFARLAGDALANGRARLVIVAHGGTVMAVGSHYGVPHRDYFDWQPKNGVAVRLHLDEAGWQTAHELTPVE